MEPPPAPNREVVPAPKVEAVSVPLVQPVQPQAEASAGTRVAALSDVPIASTQKPTPPTDPAVTALLARAQEMIRMRDISSARLLLERMLQTGSAQAAFELAQTYDPAMLLEWKVRGLSGDAVKARELYTLASERGSSKAGERLQALK
jgi:TPR repeat protein